MWRESLTRRVTLLKVAFAMDGGLIYADISLPPVASSPRDLPSGQHSDHRPCPRWHRIVLWVGLGVNIILVAAVIAMGVWGRNTHISSSEHTRGHEYGHTGGDEGNRILEDFKSRLKEELCMNSTTSPGNGSCRLCPLMWLLNKDKCYWISASIQSWNKSNEDCMAKRSQLFVGPDLTDQEFIQNKIRAPVWIGLHLVLTEKKWAWVDGSPLDQTQSQGFPLQGNHCGTLRKKKIDHEECAQRLHWVCEKKSVRI
ncbi:killer cell lectin-like receptor subfamily B member 1B allele C [Paroedura picta]|uniref:killer cell lectin-like receptor subfamily B member 1B allele C n=1 Tax=Paroedura picta TaxID=143630 RepID=UPI0040571979